MEDTKPGDLFDDAAEEFPFDDCTDNFSDAETVESPPVHVDFPSPSLRLRYDDPVSYLNSTHNTLKFSTKMEKDKNVILNNIENSNGNSVITGDSIVTDVNGGGIHDSEVVESNVREIDELNNNVLFDLASLAINAVKFQVNVLVTVMSLIIKLFTFPVWVIYSAYMFVMDPFQIMRRGKQYVMGKFMRSFGFVFGKTRDFVSEWLKEHSSVWRLGLKLGWGCLWSVYVCVVLVGLLVSAFIMGGILMRVMVEEPIRMTEPLNFDYTSKSPVAYVPVIGVNCGVDNKDYVDVGMVGGVRVIPPNHQLQVTVTLTLPESDYNRNLGVFQVKVDFLAANGKVLASSRRPCMLQFKSHPIRLLSTFLKVAPLITGYTSESQKLKVDLKGFTEGFIPTACLRVTIEQRAEFHPGGGIPEMYAAFLTLESELPFLKRMLWYWKTTLFVWVSMTLFTFEFLFTLLCCKPLIIPRLRLRQDSNSRTGTQNNPAIESFFTIFICFTAGYIEAQTGHLPQDEVEALKEIASELRKKDWDFKGNPCDGNNTKWSTPKRSDMPLYNNTLICNCSFPDALCHVQSIFLKGQDLAGVLPASLAKLPYLKKIDLNRNYLSGTIPPEWATTKLELMVVANNRLSGPIPEYIGNITSLTFLSVEANLFNGSLPAEMGKLVDLQMLILSANNITGQWPVELNNLTQLTELRISSNSFVGKLPNFESWKNLQMLEIQASGFDGPIAPSISVLTSLNELRISDLNGGASEFPPLKNMTGMTKLILRSCNIYGKIPDLVADMSELRFLDLSFNKLEGGIANIESLTNLEATYLTGNTFVGPIPDWLKSRDTRYVIDLSYNKFDESSEPSTCRDNLNLFRSFKGGNFEEHGKCLSNSPCSEDKYSFHINCGGGRVIIGNTTYEADEDSAGAAKFVYWKGNWGASSTGHFWDRTISLNDYKADNVSAIKGNDSQLYMTARLSPLSLTYFARCLANGNYTLTLHFAEIVFRDNRSFQSLGRRIFDIYIQDELKLKDFDIDSVAGGVDKALKEKFTVAVKDKSVEVRFQYSGKGTTSIPSRGTYGPLVSAISVEANFKPPEMTSSNRKKKIQIAAGVVTSSLALILMILFVAWRKRRNRKMMEQELRGLDLQTGIFTFRQIKAATSNFDAANKLGEGGFGAVYKGKLADGTIIAVKQLSSKSRQGNREFVNEIGMMSGLHHPNLVRLYGCCVERNQLLLVYEYMENNSLHHALFGPEECRPKMDWPTRQKICVGIAKGLAFLHEESPLKMIHRDIKATNVLLDKDLNPKISDFGLAKLDDEGKTHITTRVAGTIGYMAPEYALWGYLTHKVDMYSFGVVVLELVAGKNNMKYHPDENYVCLLDWALVLQRKGKFLELVDPQLGSNFNKEEALRMIKVALLCTNPSPALRPNMSVIVNMLEGRLDVDVSNIDSSNYDDEFNFQGLRDKFDEMQVNSSENQSLFRSSGTKDTDRSSSAVPSTFTTE